MHTTSDTNTTTSCVADGYLYACAELNPTRYLTQRTLTGGIG